ncbi:hypothetical protein A8924_3554 [Saccharopolyspora erythraea NRRL 2338]|nr:hypothetical protein A8924_3554 [Saccharopolyspora erythraea NRRL 2338]
MADTANVRTSRPSATAGAAATQAVSTHSAQSHSAARNAQTPSSINAIAAHSSCIGRTSRCARRPAGSRAPVIARPSSGHPMPGVPSGTNSAPPTPPSDAASRTTGARDVSGAGQKPSNSGGTGCTGGGRPPPGVGPCGTGTEVGIGVRAGAGTELGVEVGARAGAGVGAGSGPGTGGRWASSCSWPGARDSASCGWGSPEVSSWASRSGTSAGCASASARSRAPRVSSGLPDMILQSFVGRHSLRRIGGRQVHRFGCTGSGRVPPPIRPERSSHNCGAVVFRVRATMVRPLRCDRLTVFEE